MELLAIGDAAVPVLASLFNGEAKNSHGVPYHPSALDVTSQSMQAANALKGIASFWPIENHKESS